MTQKFIDKDGLKVLWNQISLKDYPNNETLMAVIDAIDETKANKDEIVQADWNQTDENKLDYIKNKPFGIKRYSITNTIIEPIDIYDINTDLNFILPNNENVKYATKIDNAYYTADIEVVDGYTKTTTITNEHCQIMYVEMPNMGTIIHREVNIKTDDTVNFALYAIEDFKNDGSDYIEILTQIDNKYLPSNTFIAEYELTSFDKIKEAYDSGKYVLCRSFGIPDGVHHIKINSHIAFYAPDLIRFSGVYKSNLIYFEVNSNNEWSMERIQPLTGGSTDYIDDYMTYENDYPTVEAVKKYVENKKVIVNIPNDDYLFDNMEEFSWLPNGLYNAVRDDKLQIKTYVQDDEEGNALFDELPIIGLIYKEDDMIISYDIGLYFYYEIENNQLYSYEYGSLDGFGSLEAWRFLGYGQEDFETTATTVLGAINEINSKVANKVDKTYVDERVASLVNSAPETLDTLGELATAFEENAEVVDALNAAITNKADKSDIPTKLSELEADVEFGIKSWNELNDRPFGEEPNVTVLETTTVTMDMYMEAFGAFYIQKNIELIEGESYIVTYNGREYECKCGSLPFDTGEANVMINYVGNSLPLNNVNSGEPFFISDATPVLGGGIGFGSIADSSDSSWEIGIVKKGDINYLDPKYVTDMYYSEEKEIIVYPPFTHTPGSNSLNVSVYRPFIRELIEGVTYDVYLNDTIYKCVAKKINVGYLENNIYHYNDAMCLGNPIHCLNNGVENAQDTGEPFFIYDYIGSPTSTGNHDYVTFCFSKDYADIECTIEIRLRETICNKIPAEYLDLSTKKLSELENDLYGDIDKLEDVYSAKWGDDSQFIGGDEEVRIILINIPTTPLLVAGVTYIVEIDGIKYRLISEVNSEQYGIYDIGNKNIKDSSCENTGEPFYIVFSKYDGTAICLRSNTSFETISIKKVIGTTTKRIPAKYVEPPYGEREAELLPETTLTLEDGQAQYTSLGLVVGDKYIVNWNGTDYECVAESALYQDINVVVIGNSPLFFGTGDSGHPFAIGDSSLLGGCIIADTTGASSATLSIKYFDTIKINSKYIDAEWMAISEIKKADCLLDVTTDVVGTSGNYNIAHFDVDYDLFRNGEIFIIQFKDKEYQCNIIRTYNSDGEINTIYLGNVSFFNENLVNTKEPFCIVCNVIDLYLDGNYILTPENLPEGTTIKIWSTEEKVKELPPEFIKDMYYDGTRSLLPKSRLVPNDTHSTYIGFPSLGLIYGEDYIVIHNGIKYDLTADIMTTGSFSGNVCLGKYNNCPFNIIDIPPDETYSVGAYSIGTTQYADGWEPYEMEIIKEDIHTIDPKYIKDMYYDNTKVLLPKSTLTCNDTAVIYMSSPGVTLGLEEGETYIVTFNEVKYECVSYNNTSTVINDVTLGGDGYPFEITEWLDGSKTFSISCTDVIPTTTPYSFTIEIVKEDIHKIPEKYLPDSVDYIIMNSSTEGSTKQFKITIGDDGVLVASEL